MSTHRFQHLRILASAGSGKTYQLTTRYLQLLAAGADPNSILATTFTRAAAGEIRDRLLRDLAEAAIDPNQRRALAKRLDQTALSEDDVLEILASLAAQLHRLQIRTLDSFFATVVRSFALELGIGADAGIVEQELGRRYRREAVRLMLDERDPQRLVDLLRKLTQGTSDRSVLHAIDRTVEGLYALYREADQSAWEQIEAPPRLREDQVNNAIHHLSECAVPTHKNFAKGHANDVRRAWAREWEEFVAKGLGSKIIQGQPNYYGLDINPQLVEAYQPLLRHAEAVLLGRVRDQTIATRKLLELYHRHYEQVMRRGRAMTFDDVTQAMTGACDRGSLDEICFRIDAKLHHLLLDEFQDTSIQQWRALQPIVDEIISHQTTKRTFFCVGDVKQSIYGWRDASPEVLDEIPRLLRGPDGRSAVVDRHLAKSYRSSQIIIDVVNRLFTRLSDNPALNDYPDAANVWAKQFRKHETAKELPGYAQLLVAPRAGEGEKQDLVRLQCAADLVAKLHRAAPQRSIGVLTRTNPGVARLMYELGPTCRKTPATGRGGLPLTDSAAVNTVLDLLRLTDHPDDTISAYNVRHSPLGTLIGLTTLEPRRCHTVAREVRRDLLRDGYALTIARWVGRLAPACDQRQLRRLLELVELAGLYDADSTQRADDFVACVEMRQMPDAAPSTIEVMTIHQAKGLEFDIVVLPQLDGRQGQLTGNKPPPVVFERESPTGRITRICRYMKHETLALAPQLQPMFTSHIQRTVRESLSLLYVAMTRARHALHIVIDPPRANERSIPRTLAGVLRSALADGPLEPGQCAYVHGDPNWLGVAQRPEAPIEPEPTDKITIRLAPSTGPVVHAAVSPSKLAQRDLASALSFPDDEALQRGVAVHDMFHQVEWLEDWQSNPDTLQMIARRVAPRRGEDWAQRQVKSFLRMVERPAVRAALSYGDREPSTLRLWREHPYARLVDGAVQRGAIDRLEARIDKGKLRAATVIDFKIDDIAPSEAPARAERYRPQLEAYRDAAAEMLRTDPAGVKMIVLFVTPGEAVVLL
ncbi:MAG: UvrD-helicase domain-containing protein [Planctomycetes bacterium]|nr:UvrD-helicase domain-containing protein [Planctomycetota bacterium]